MKSSTQVHLSHKQLARKLLVCLPVCPLDIEMADELTKLWVELEPAKNPRIDIFIALRYDMEESETTDAMLKRLKTKFNSVHIQKSPFQGTGWPHGCNSLEIGALHIFAEYTRDRRWPHRFMFMCEADTVPLRPTWLHELMEEAYDHDVPILGAKYNDRNGAEHINGNAIFRNDFWKFMPEIWSCPPELAWDFQIRRKAMRYGAASRLIWQEYRLDTEENPWKGEDHLFHPKRHKGDNNPLAGEDLWPAMFHGCKSFKAIDAVRKRYNLPPRE